MIETVEDLGSGGGSSAPIDSFEVFNRYDLLFTDSNDATWLKTGTIETDVLSYPLAKSFVLGSYTNVSFSTPQVPAPRGLAWDGVHFWVLSGVTSDPKLYKYDAAGASIDNFAVQSLSSATDVVFDGVDLVVIQSNYWVRHTLAGVYVASGSMDSGASAITFDGTYLWVFNSNSMVQYNLDFTKTGVTIDITFGPTGMAWDGSNFWLCDRYYAYQYTANGVFTGSKIDIRNEATDVEGIVWDGVNLVTTDENTKYLYKYDCTSTRYVGHPTVEYGGEVSLPVYVRIK
ncbi:MAG: hypothetical protein COB83_08820 [Gammaproteobacteria bacterium]|nr:MAG: hypothetical protein COB83_08820 [Gammaproteobacteria bacterium]